MKSLLSLLIIAILFVGCKSSRKQLERGDYDAALQKSAKKIKRNPSKNDDEVWVFNDAYNMATVRDNDAIIRLKKKGDPAQGNQGLKTSQFTATYSLHTLNHCNIGRGGWKVREKRPC